MARLSVLQTSPEDPHLLSSRAANMAARMTTTTILGSHRDRQRQRLARPVLLQGKTSGQPAVAGTGDDGDGLTRGWTFILHISTRVPLVDLISLIHF